MLRYYYLTWFSQPAADRPLYKLLHSRHVSSIVELGMGQGERTKRLLEMAVKPTHAEQPLRYTGIDLFEARSPGSPGVSLKAAYTQLKTDHVNLQLVPGDPLMALSRAANGLANTDVLIISLDQVGDALNQAWRWVPRMLHNDSLVYLERAGKKVGETKFDLVSPLDIARWAAEAQRTARRAA